MPAKSSSSSGGLALLDVVVLIAMAVTATAFAAGLIINSGIDEMAGAIVGAALFMVMASAHYVITRSAGSAIVGGRLAELEEALIVLDGDLQRIDQVEDDVARLDLLTDRVERLDRTVTESTSGDTGTDMAEVERLSKDLEQLRSRLEALRSDLQVEAQTQREEIGAELRSLEGLIKDLSRDLIVASPAPKPWQSSVISQERHEMPEASWRRDDAEEILNETPPHEAVLPPELEAEPPESETVVDVVTMVAEADEGDDIVVLVTEEATSVAEEPSSVTEETAFVPEEATFVAEDAAFVDDASVRDEDMRRVLRAAIDASRIELYLQPIVTLPDRELRYCDSITRIRTDADELLPPARYVRVAEQDGLMPRIDNVTLVKSVQLLRRLGPESKLKGAFCAISAQSLLDADFFPELVEFMEENSALGDSLTFKVSQPAIQDLGANELGSLKTLGKLGFCFALDQITDLDLDYDALRDHFFRFVKVDADILLHGMEGARAPVPAADMAGHLDRFDLQLIVEQVEAESLDRLMDYGVELAQGDLFAEPKPLSPELIREFEGADAV